MGNLFPEVAGYQATTGPGLSNEVPTSTAVLYSDRLESLPADPTNRDLVHHITRLGQQADLISKYKPLARAARLWLYGPIPWHGAVIMPLGRARVETCNPV